MKKNDVLKKYIRDKYGSTSKFLKKEKFSHQHLEIMLDKKDVFHEIGIAVKVCCFLGIDASKLFCEKIIASAEKDGNENPEPVLSLDDMIKEKYAGLSKDKRKKILEYADYIYANGDSQG